MNYTKLSEIIEEIIDPSDITPNAQSITDDYNNVIMKWKFPVKKTLIIKPDYVEIIHQFTIDMVELFKEIEIKGYENLTREIAFNAIVSNYDKSILLIYNKQYEKLAELVNEKRGKGLEKKLGI